VLFESGNANSGRGRGVASNVFWVNWLSFPGCVGQVGLGPSLG
jgi:hypothetical protein